MNYLKKASLDSDIKDLDDFERFARRTSPTLANQTAQTFAVRARPGQRLKIQVDTERLRNRPSERANTYEVSTNDTISFSTYRQMGFDPVIQFNMLLLKGWISGLKYSVSSPDTEVAALLSHALKEIYGRLIKDLLSSIQYGFTFGEKVWKREKLDLQIVNERGEPETTYSGEAVTIARIKFINPEANLKYFKGKTDDIVHILQQQGQTETKVLRDKLVWMALDSEFSGVFGRSRFKSVYPDWYYSQTTRQQLLRHVTRTGSPPLTVRYPDGITRLSLADQAYLGAGGETIDNVDVAEGVATSYLNQGTILLPSERDPNSKEYLWSIGFDNVANSDTSPFLTVLKLLDGRMSSGLGIPANLGTGDSSFAESSANSELLIVVLEDLVEQIERVIKADVVDQLAAFNFGPEAIPNISFSIDKSALGRRKYLKEIFINTLRLSMSKNGVMPKGFPSIEEMARELGFKISPSGEVLGSSLDVFGSDVGSESEGENPETTQEQDEASNDPNRNRATRDRERDQSVGGEASEEATSTVSS